MALYYRLFQFSTPQTMLSDLRNFLLVNPLGPSFLESPITEGRGAGFIEIINNAGDGGETITIGAITIVEGVHWNWGVSSQLTATSIANAITANMPGQCTATSLGETVYILAIATGVGGNYPIIVNDGITVNLRHGSTIGFVDGTGASAMCGGALLPDVNRLWIKSSVSVGESPLYLDFRVETISGKDVLLFGWTYPLGTSSIPINLDDPQMDNLWGIGGLPAWSTTDLDVAGLDHRMSITEDMLNAIGGMFADTTSIFILASLLPSDHLCLYTGEYTRSVALTDDPYPVLAATNGYYNGAPPTADTEINRGFPVFIRRINGGVIDDTRATFLAGASPSYIEGDNVLVQDNNLQNIPSLNNIIGENRRTTVVGAILYNAYADWKDGGTDYSWGYRYLFRASDSLPSSVQPAGGLPPVTLTNLITIGVNDYAIFPASRVVGTARRIAIGPLGSVI